METANKTVVGTTISGRNLPIENIHKSVGLFINTLPLVVNHDYDDTVIRSIQSIQEKINEMNNRSNFNLSSINNGQMKHSLFESLFVFENYPEISNEVEQDLKIEIKNAIEKIDYPLMVLAYETNNSLRIQVDFDNEIIDSEIMDNVIILMSNIICQIRSNPMMNISDLKLLNQQQIEKMNESNGIGYSLEKQQYSTLHQIFEEIVEVNPDKTAIVFYEIKLTYRELNERSNQLAHYLRSLTEIKPDDKIALILDKSEKMIISILAVWKSGAAYVPIDPSYPIERIKFILEDTQAKVLIANNIYCNLGLDIITVDVDSVNTSKVCQSNLGPISNGSNLAYIIYTSGSTGKPKGVMIEHQSVISFRNDVIYRYLDSSFDHSILFFSNYVFDVSVEQLCLSVLNTHKCIIAHNILNFEEEFYSYLNENQVTYLSGPSSKIQILNLNKLKYLKTIVLGGEELKENAFKQMRYDFKGVLRNALGATESTVANNDYAYLNANQEFKNSVGKPLSNTNIYVLNDNLQMLPINAIGELYYSGECLARGYLNRPDLTADRFLPNPFQTEEEKRLGKNSRIYKTGDLVRMLSNGELEYLGRNDFQVKIRGLRIELGEIENAISSFEGIKQAVVLAKDKSDEKKQKYLIGYYVSENILDESDIKEYLQTKIPEYMIPNRLVRIEKVPVTINGKLDKKALPEIEFTAQKDNYEAPRNEIESKLCQIWSEVLGLENVGINDDFFKLGGDSIQSIQIVGRINQDLRIHVSIKDIFIHKTISNISSYLSIKPIRILNGTFDAFNSKFQKLFSNSKNSFNFDFSINQSSHFDLFFFLLASLGFALKSLSGDLINFVNLKNLDFFNHFYSQIPLNFKDFPICLKVEEDFQFSLINIKQEISSLFNKTINSSLFHNLNLPCVSFEIFDFKEESSSVDKN